MPDVPESKIREEIEYLRSLAEKLDRMKGAYEVGIASGYLVAADHLSSLLNSEGGEGPDVGKTEAEKAVHWFNRSLEHYERAKAAESSLARFRDLVSLALAKWEAHTDGLSGTANLLADHLRAAFFGMDYDEYTGAISNGWSPREATNATDRRSPNPEAVEVLARIRDWAEEMRARPVDPVAGVEAMNVGYRSAANWLLSLLDKATNKEAA